MFLTVCHFFNSWGVNSCRYDSCLVVVKMFFIKFYIYVGSSTDVCAFIKARGEAEHLFTGHKNTAMEGWK